MTYVPFDPDYYAIGALEPEFVTEVDWESFDRMHIPDELETYTVRDGAGRRVLVLADGPEKLVRSFKTPTKKELRWRNTLGRNVPLS